MADQLSKVKVCIAGICSLIVTVGVARFSYTSLLPIMQTQTGLSEAMGGWLATSNYIGYMCGVLLAANLTNLRFKYLLYRSYLILSILTTTGMMFTEHWLAWSLLRFVAGTCASAGLILASGFILKWLVEQRHRAELGIHFSGAGISILCTALLVEYLSYQMLGWQAQWGIFAIMALLFSIPAWLWMPSPHKNPKSLSEESIKDTPPSRQFMLLLLVAYFCAGYGFAINATFIVDIVEGIDKLQGKGQWAFALVGLAAIPAVIIWDLIAREIGYLKSLLIAYALQVIGIMLLTLSDNLAVIFFSALLFGGTFIACVSLVLTMAGLLFPSNPAKFMGKMTLAYGVAQIIAPICTGWLVQYFGDYHLGLYLAALIMGLGVVLLIMLIKLELSQSNTRQHSFL
jgi:predicted MFS family arabinose efflux permease